MRIGICALSKNGYFDVERLAFSLHAQTYPDWQCQIMDYGSSPALDDVIWPMNKIRHCSGLLDRFWRAKVTDQESFEAEIRRGLLSARPAIGIIGFCDVRIRFHYNLFGLLLARFNEMTDIVQVEARKADGGSSYVFFVRRHVLERGLPRIVEDGNGGGFLVVMPSYEPAVRSLRLGQTHYADLAPVAVA